MRSGDNADVFGGGQRQYVRFIPGVNYRTVTAVSLVSFSTSLSSGRFDERREEAYRGHLGHGRNSSAAAHMPSPTGKDESFFCSEAHVTVEQSDPGDTA